MCVAGIGLVMLFFSWLLSIFRAKYHGYPYRCEHVNVGFSCLIDCDRLRWCFVSYGLKVVSSLLQLPDELVLISSSRVRASISRRTDVLQGAVHSIFDEKLFAKPWLSSDLFNKVSTSYTYGAFYNITSGSFTTTELWSLLCNMNSRVPKGVFLVWTWAKLFDLWFISNLQTMFLS